jgi:hypothetical protein
MFPLASHPGQHVLGLGEVCIVPRTTAACYTLELWHRNHVPAARQLCRQVVPLFVVLGLATLAVEEQDEWISSALAEEWGIVGGSVDAWVEDPQCYRRVLFPQAEVLEPVEHRRQHAGLPADVASLFRRVAAPPLYTAEVRWTNVAAPSAVVRVVVQIGVTDPAAAARFLWTADRSAALFGPRFSVGQFHCTAVAISAADLYTTDTGGVPTANRGETYVRPRVGAAAGSS